MSNKNPPQTLNEMVKSQNEKKIEQLSVVNGRTPYNRTEGDFKSEKVAELVESYTNELVLNMKYDRISLDDTSMVQKCTITYLEACRRTGSFPTNMGLARALGCTQRSLNEWRQKKPHHPTGEWLEMFAETCSDILSQSALKGNADKVFSIFMCKAQYGWRDNVDINVTNTEQPHMEVDIESIRSKYIIPSN